MCGGEQKLEMQEKNGFLALIHAKDSFKDNLTQNYAIQLMGIDTREQNK